MSIFFDGFYKVIKDVAMAFAPMVLIFIFFQLFFIRWSLKRFLFVLRGMALAYLGLVLFLHGVHLGFEPMGRLMGSGIGALSYRWIMVPLAFVFGFLACFAEPAVRVLIYEVEKATSAYINKMIMLYFLSFGVAVSVSLAVVRILFSFSLLWIVIPGYVLAFMLSRKANKTFVAIAFDSGGVATGPMVVAFVLSMILGFSSAIEGSNPLLDGFGMIALVALTPILSILTLGLIYEQKGKSSNDE
jgi:hypothetical protein